MENIYKTGFLSLLVIAGVGMVMAAYGSQGEAQQSAVPGLQSPDKTVDSGLETDLCPGGCGKEAGSCGADCTCGCQDAVFGSQSTVLGTEDPGPKTCTGGCGMAAGSCGADCTCGCQDGKCSGGCGNTADTGQKTCSGGCGCGCGG